MKLEGRSFIGYTRGKGSDAIPGAGRNPRTGEFLEPSCIAATPEEVESACAMAASAFPVFSSLPGRERALFLRRIASNIESLADEIDARMTMETGLPAGRAQGERGRTCAQLRMFADVIDESSWVDARIDTAQPDRKPLPKPDLRSMWRPLGPVAVFCAGNFPLAFSVAGGDTASALAAGNPVIVNAHIAHPGVAELVGGAVAGAARDCGMPEGVFSLVYGNGFATGQALVRHPSIRAVGFTGSQRGGRALMEIAASRPVPIPVYAEMSSVNPVIILPGAAGERGDAIAEALHGAINLGAGQFCTAPGLILAPGDSALIAALTRRCVETPAAVMLNEGIARAYAAGVERLRTHPEVQTLAEGAEDTSIFAPARAALFATTSAALLADPVLQAEVFGPCALIVRYDALDELTAILTTLAGQLTVTVQAAEADLGTVQGLMEQLAQLAGRVIVNGVPTGVEVCDGMVHGGPFPATSDGRTTSVGPRSILRFCREVCYQNVPDALLPAVLRQEN